MFLDGFCSGNISVLTNGFYYVNLTNAIYDNALDDKYPLGTTAIYECSDGYKMAASSGDLSPQSRCEEEFTSEGLVAGLVWSSYSAECRRKL